MTADEFVALVVEMRAAQKRYFAARRRGQAGHDEKAAAIALERRVDQAAAAWGETPEPTLFDLGGEG